MLQGRNVFTQNWQAAVFQDMGSNPSNMQSGKAADCYGCMPRGKVLNKPTLNRRMSKQSYKERRHGSPFLRKHGQITGIGPTRHQSIRGPLYDC